MINGVVLLVFMRVLVSVELFVLVVCACMSVYVCVCMSVCVCLCVSSGPVLDPFLPLRPIRLTQGLSYASFYTLQDVEGTINTPYGSRPPFVSVQLITR